MMALKECLKEMARLDVIGISCGLVVDAYDLKRFIPGLKNEDTEDVKFKYIDFLSNIITDVINTLHNEDDGFTCEPAEYMMEKKVVLYACTKAMIWLTFDETFPNKDDIAYLSIIAPLNTFNMMERFLGYLTRSAMKYGITVAPLRIWSPIWKP